MCSSAASTPRLSAMRKVCPSASQYPHGHSIGCRQDTAYVATDRFRHVPDSLLRIKVKVGAPLQARHDETSYRIALVNCALAQ